MSFRAPRTITTTRRPIATANEFVQSSRSMLTSREPKPASAHASERLASCVVYPRRRAPRWARFAAFHPKDCRWLAGLLQHGLVQPSSTPPRDISKLRDLTRFETDSSLFP